MIHHKLNPTPIERWLKDHYIRFRNWLDDYGMVVAMIANLVWLITFWYGILGMK
jgi:hypothetical protein